MSAAWLLLWTALPLMLACDPAPPGFSSAPFEPLLAQLDRDGDGRVSAQEYDAVAFAAPPFDEVDRNQSGTLDPEELLRLALNQDPNSFDREDPGFDEEKLTAELTGPSDDPEAVQLKALLEFLVEEIRALDPEAPLPSDRELQRVAATRKFRSPEAQAMLQQLEAEFNRLGLVFPTRLSRPPDGPGRPQQGNASKGIVRQQGAPAQAPVRPSVAGGQSP